MRISLSIAWLLLVAGAAQLAANPGTGTLTLVTPQTGINKLTITVSATASGFTASDTQTTNVTGTVNGAINSDPTTGATTAMTITGGDIAMSNMHFVLSVLFGLIKVADISTANMGGTAYTPAPIPAAATATATGGTFDAALHRVLINRGTMTGSITATSPATPVNADFATSPVEGAGTGTGTITMVAGAADATHRTFQATVVIPVDFTDTQDMSGTPVSIKVSGTIKATGPVRIPLNPLATPTFSHAAGVYPAGQAIAITGESGSTIFYRLNGGTEQSAASPVTGLTVPAYPATLAISAYAKKSGWADSAATLASYSAPPPTATPVFSPAAGQYSAGQAITITGATGATIYYRLNGGTEQSAASPVTGLTVPAYPGTLAISAYARKSGNADSATAQVTYTSPPPTATPVFSPAAGQYSAGQAITITGATGATIYYRLNGGTELSAASPVTGLTVPAYPATLAISAYARKSGNADSATAQVTYTSPPPTATPVFSPAAGQYSAGQAITITGDAGATIYYRLNGGTELSAASPVTGLAVPAYPGTLAISAYAKKSGWADSAVTQVSYGSLSPFVAWARAAFPGVTDPAVLAPDADPDHDGQSNFFEFALGGNPNHPLINATSHSQLGDNGNPELAGELLLTIAVRNGTPPFTGSPALGAIQDGISYAVQGSVNLADFNTAVLPLATAVAGLPAAPSGYEYRSFRLARAATIPASGFLRVRIAPAP